MSKKHPTGDEGNRESFFSKLFRPETDEEEKIVPDGAETVSDDDPFGFEFEEAPVGAEDLDISPAAPEKPAEMTLTDLVINTAPADETPAEPADGVSPRPRRRRGRRRVRPQWSAHPGGDGSYFA